MFKLFLLYLVVIPGILTRPQEENIEDLVNIIFTSPKPTGQGQTVTSSPRRPGFAGIVTAEPNVNPTSQTQNTDNSGSSCKCVQYFLCNPTNNSVVGEIDGFGRIDIRLETKYCDDILDVCCGGTKIQETPIPVRKQVDKVNRAQGCGVRNKGGIDFELIGNLDNEAGFGEFPWTVALISTIDEKYICGGSLIHPKVVLTANHCVRKLNARNIKIRAGEWDTQTVKERLPFQERQVSQIINHPAYDIGTVANDYSLLVLREQINLSDHINVVCLPAANTVSNNQNCYVSGWGKDIFGQEGKYSAILKRVPLPIVPSDQCEASLRTTKLGPGFQLSPTFICAGGRKGVDTCEGDGGSPLVCAIGPESENRYAQVGIVAWGIGCNEARPAVYANVQLARDWIDSEMKKLGFDPSIYSNPTSEPQFFQDNDGANCKCVPYDLCNPTNDSQVNEVDGFGLLDIRFDAESCQDVLDVCCKEQKIQDKPIPVRPVTEKPNRAQGCGIRNVGGLDFQIIGDLNNEAGFGEFPWTVALIKTPEEICLCGGSLIHPQVVLTGNHCVRKLSAQNLKIRAGEWDTQTIKERLPYQEQFAGRIISHPQYDAKTLANNYALVVLQQPFQLADHINVVCLPPQNFLSSSQNCYASGWGKDLFGKQGKYSVIMKKVRLPIVPTDQCENELRKTRLGPSFQLHPTYICAGGEKGEDTCQGDGGAPLVCPVGPTSDNRYSQSGIVSWGIGCNEARPAVYANVALARNWIDTQIRSLGYDPSVYTY